MIKSIIAFMSAMFQTNHQPSISQPVEKPQVDFEAVVANIPPLNVQLDFMAPGYGRRDMAKPPHISIPAGQGGRRRIAL